MKIKNDQKHMKSIIIIAMVFLFSGIMNAQRPDDKDTDKELMESRMEQLKSDKVAFFTDKMNLDAKTAQKFWPLYNECEAKKMEFHGQFRELMKGMHKDDAGNLNMTDTDYLKLADGMVNIKLRLAQLQSDYHEKYKLVLSPEQLVKFYRADEQFGREMLKRYHGKSRDDADRNSKK